MKHTVCKLFLAFLFTGSWAVLAAQGNVGIGTVTPGFPLDIVGAGERVLNIVNNSPNTGLTSGIYIDNSASGNSAHYGIANFVTGPGTGTKYGIYSGILGEGDGSHYASYQWLTGAGEGDQYGSYANISNTGDGNHYGARHQLAGPGNGDQYGVFNLISNDGDGLIFGVRNDVNGQGINQHYGVWNYLYGIGPGSQRGVYNSITNSGDGQHTGVTNNLSGAGSGTHTGTSNQLVGLGDGSQIATNNNISNDGDGNHYGTYNLLSGEGSGTKYAVFSLTPAEANGIKYAGYFTGNVQVIGVLSNPSDACLKKDIIQMKSAGTLARLKSVGIYQYSYDHEGYRSMTFPEGVQTGVVAQQLQEVFPELVTTQVHPEVDMEIGGETIHTPEVEYLGVNYIGLIPHLIKGLQEQQELIEIQGEQIRLLRAELEEMRQ